MTGIRLYQFDDGYVQIIEIVPDGLIAQNTLRKGCNCEGEQYLLNVEVCVRASDVIDIINNAERAVTVVVTTGKCEM